MLKGHDYITVVADAVERRVVYVTEGRSAVAIERFAHDLVRHGGDPGDIEAVSIDMSPAFIRGVSDHLHNAQITFDKFHVIAHASIAVDQMRRGIRMLLNPLEIQKSLNSLREPAYYKQTSAQKSQVAALHQLY